MDRLIDLDIPKNQTIMVYVIDGELKFQNGKKIRTLFTSAEFEIPRISDYKLTKKRNDEFMTERTKILELTRDLERIKQMDDLVRASLGTTLDIDPEPVIIDSSAGILEAPNRQVSYIENIPSLAPISITFKFLFL